MKAFAVLFNLAMAAAAIASAIDTRALVPGLTERACGANGSPCTSGDDCCVFCNPISGTCSGNAACVPKGTIPPLDQNDCCSSAVDSSGKCT